MYEQLFEDDPSDKQASAALRELYQAASAWEKLGRLLERLIDQADGATERSALRLELARLNVERFEAVDTAVDLLRTVLEEEPGHSDAVVALSELYEKAKRDEELAELLQQQIEVAKRRGDTEAELRFQVRLGEIYDSRLGDRPKAIETYQAVLGREGSHRGALEALARLYRAQGELGEAAKYLDRLLSLSEGAEAVRLANALADVHEKLGDRGAAVSALERGLAAERTHAELRARVAAMFEATEAWDKLAAHWIEEADLAEGVDQKVALLRKAADIQTKKRADPAAASLVLEKASALAPDDRELLLLLCDAYSASGRGKAAAEVLEKIVESYGGKRSKELAEIHRRLAEAHLADGNTAKALEELDKAFRIEPGNVHVLKALGLVALRVEDFKKAMQMFRALLLQKLDGDTPITKAEVFFHLGEIHLKLGEKPKALQMLERAVQADDKLDSAKKLLAELKG
jgi:tetratricopeptide (TPR) repeat protein